MADKVDVSGTTFAAVFFIIYSIMIPLNLFVFDSIGQIQFYMIGVPYFVFMMFAMAGYRSILELCFYCKFLMISMLLELLCMIILHLESFPYAFFWIIGAIFVITIMLKAFINDESRKKRAKR